MRASKIGALNESVRCMGQLAWARFLLGAEDEASALAARVEELLGQVTGGAFLFGAQAYAATARVLLATGAAQRGEDLVRPVLGGGEAVRVARSRPLLPDWCWVFARRRGASSIKRARRLPQPRR